MIERLQRGWTRYWFAPAPVVDLAVARIVIVGVQLYILFPAQAALGRLRADSVLPGELYDPLPILHLLVAPLGWTYRPGFEVLELVYWVAVGTGVTALIGLFTNLSLLVFAWSNIFLAAFKWSFGDVHHQNGLIMIALVALALGPAGRSLSVDSWRARFGARNVDQPGGEDQHTSRFALWPLLLIRYVMALAYFSAAYRKMSVAGVDWMNGYTLQHYVLQDAVRWDIPLGLWLGQQFWLIQALSVLTVVWEGTFFLVLIFPRLAWFYVPVGLGFHTMTWIAMRAGFFQFMALYAALVPWRATWLWWLNRRGPGLQSLPVDPTPQT